HAARAAPQFSNTKLPPHGLSGLRPAGSGRSDSSRIPNDRRFNLAAVCNTERVSADFHPYGTKNSGPFRGANVSGEPASLSGPPMDFWSILRSAGDVRSVTQRRKVERAARSRARSAAASARKYMMRPL